MKSMTSSSLRRWKPKNVGHFDGDIQFIEHHSCTIMYNFTGILVVFDHMVKGAGSRAQLTFKALLKKRS